MGHFYAGPERWDGVHAALQRQAERGRCAGLDSEFYNLDIRKQSCAGGRSRLHLWSVAVNRWPLRLTPRGYYEADACVLTADALNHDGLREWLESDAPKVVHNLAVDAHTFFNSGVCVGGTINTLAWARFCRPERARGAGFDLDGLGVDLLGVGKAGSFSEIFTEHYIEVIEKPRRTKGCACGVQGCRKRKTEHTLDLDPNQPELGPLIVEIRHDKIETVEIERQWRTRLVTRSWRCGPRTSSTETCRKRFRFHGTSD
jgi:hypothetical protein